MIICVFSDVHGNLPFLEAVIARWTTQAIDTFVFLGDAVGYFPDNAAVLRRIGDFAGLQLLGNHDAMALGQLPLDPVKDTVYRLGSFRDTLDEDTRKRLSARTSSADRIFGSVRCRFLHGTPDDPLLGYGYETNDRVTAFDDPDIDFLFMGHTHRPWIRHNRHTTVVNVGSIGLPRDIGNAPSYALLDTVNRTIRLERLILSDEELDALVPATTPIHDSVRACLRRRDDASTRSSSSALPS